MSNALKKIYSNFSSFNFILRFLTIVTALLILQSYLLNAEDSNSVSSSSSEEDYENEQEASTQPENTTDIHSVNCTFNGKIYYDDECVEWMRSFYLVLSFTILGMVLFCVAIVYFGRRFCLRNSNDHEPLINDPTD